MIPKTLRQFISQLHEATDNKTVKWEEGADQAYFCVHKGLNLHISYFFDMDEGIGYYSFRIYGKKTKDIAFSVNSNEEDYYTISNLYSSIMVNAADIDDELKNFFE